MARIDILSKSAEPFVDRIEAGRLLAEALAERGVEHPAVLGIPRGGVAVAMEIARRLDGDMDIVLTHKLGAPGNPELAIGAVTEDGKLFIETHTARAVDADPRYIEDEKNHQLRLMAGRNEQCRRVLPKLDLTGRVVVVTDDGIATGATMKAALWAVRKQKARRVIAALPVGPDTSVREMAKCSDQVICLRAPRMFMALGQFYEDFRQVEDGQLMAWLEEENTRRMRHENLVEKSR